MGWRRAAIRSRGPGIDPLPRASSEGSRSFEIGQSLQIAQASRFMESGEGVRPRSCVSETALLVGPKRGPRLGGGHPELMKYKKKFSKDTIPYYVGEKVYNNALYETLVNLRIKDSRDALDTIPFFPKYRSIQQ